MPTQKITADSQTNPLPFNILVGHGFGQQAVPTTPHYNCPGASGISTTVGYIMVCPVDGMLRNFYVRTAAPSQPGTGSLVITLQVNGVDTPLVITVAAGAGAGVYGDTTHAVPITSGQTIRWKIVNNAATDSTTLHGFTVQLDMS